MLTKMKTVLWTALGAGLGFFAIVLLARWGSDNDIPVLSDFYQSF